MSEVSKKVMSIRAVEAGDACDMLAQGEIIESSSVGSLSIHKVRHAQHGDVVLVQGANDEFVLVSA